MKKLVLVIVIVGMWGTVGADNGSILIGMDVETYKLADSIFSLDTSVTIIHPYSVYVPIDTIRICCCTVFVDKPCTVYVPSVERLNWERIEKIWDEEFEKAWDRAFRKLKGYR